jgi:hypothetical protein
MTARKGKPNGTGRSSGKIGGSYGKRMKPPKGEPWVWLTRELLSSDAWRSMSINALRFVECLLIDHMGHAGTENGNLKATYGQLIAFGITSRRRVVRAIENAESLGLVDVQRRGMRTATTYTLTFYPLPDGTPPTNRWKRFASPENQKSGVRRGTRLVSEGEPDRPDLVSEGEPDPRVQRGTPSISTTTSQQNGAPPAEPRRRPTCH